MKQVWIILLVTVIPVFALSASGENCTQATRLVIEAFDLGHAPEVFPEKRALLQRALSLCQHHPEAHNNLASLLETEKEFDRALHHYRQAVLAKPGFSAAWYGLGEVYAKTGRFPLALEAYLKACHGDADARKKIKDLLKKNRYRVTEQGEVLDKESLLLLFDRKQRNAIARMISDCGFKAQVVPVVTFRNLLFETGSAVIRPDSIPQIEEIGAALKAIGEAGVKIEGHTDRQPFRGYSREESDRLNMKLSRDRAETVAEHLVRMGVSPERIETVGYGPDRPEIDENTPEAYDKNRRVVIRVEK